ncbi:Chitin synthase 2 [Gossypium arboreum]|uniref:Chitin synthase 2 n=1 Tax=Gossypium arboreum TaxID=29729 RepID=A0A0B0Q1K0_GOSAR|nr:Chitin synthase 2 [Gossypium arboreum]
MRTSDFRPQTPSRLRLKQRRWDSGGSFIWVNSFASFYPLYTRNNSMYRCALASYGDCAGVRGLWRGCWTLGRTEAWSGQAASEGCGARWICFGFPFQKFWAIWANVVLGLGLIWGLGIGLGF